MPTRVSTSWPLTVVTVPFTPTTALSLSSATVVAGLVRLIVPFWIPATTAGGSESVSTLSPTDNAVAGSTALLMTSCMRSVSVQKVSSPKVSKRKMSFPCAIRAGSSANNPVVLLHAETRSTTLHETSTAVITTDRARELTSPIRFCTGPPSLDRCLPMEDSGNCQRFLGGN